jgi:hypothetical protein
MRDQVSHPYKAITALCFCAFRYFESTVRNIEPSMNIKIKGVIKEARKCISLGSEINSNGKMETLK